MNPCDFYSHARALRNDCNSDSLILSVSVIVSWALLILFSLSQGVTSFWLFRTFCWFDVLSFDVLSTGERKISQSARFELAQEDPIWFRVRRLNHSAMTAWRRSYFYLSGSFFVELLCELLLSQDITQLPLVGSFRSVDEFSSVDQNFSKSARFQLQLDEPIWVLVNWPQRNQLWLLISFGKFYRFRSFHLELLCDLLPLSQGFTSFCLFRTFWCFAVLSIGEQKVSQSARLEFAQEDPIWFLVRRLNHSAMTAKRKFFICIGDGMFFNYCVSFYFLKVLRKTISWELLIGWWVKLCGPKISKLSKIWTWAGWTHVISIHTPAHSATTAIRTL